VTGGEIDDDVMFDGDGIDHFDPYPDLIDTDPEPPPPDDPGFPEPEPEAGYIGEPPWEAMQHWHRQEASHSCAVASQEFILDNLTGIDHSEAELAAVAEANGWYVPGQGTPVEDVGKVLEHYGIPTEQYHGASVDQLATALNEGDRVMVALDSSELMFPGGYDPDDPLDHYPGIRTPAESPPPASILLAMKTAVIQDVAERRRRRARRPRATPRNEPRTPYRGGRAPPSPARSLLRRTRRAPRSHRRELPPFPTTTVRVASSTHF
jgi:hypothetical protein